MVTSAGTPEETDMADFNKPISSDQYLALLASIVENNQATLQMLEGVTTLTNLPTNAKRWNASSNRFEKWTGTAWTTLSSLYEIKVRNSDQLNGQTAAYYRNASNLNAGTLPAARFNDTAHGNRGGGSLHAVATTSASGFMSSTDKSKLNGIEAGATGDQTANEIRSLLLTVDGAGSGIDADLLDGLHGTSFLKVANNLSDLNNVATARSNLGLGGLATKNEVTQADIATGSVGWPQIKSTFGTVSGYMSSGNSLAVTLPGSDFGFHPSTRQSGGAGYYHGATLGYKYDNNYTGKFSGVFSNTTILYQILIGNSGASPGAQTVYAAQMYITSSPPYNLGDGDIPLFVFLIVDNTTKKVEGVYSATEAPWHYNGPTKIFGKTNKDGKKTRLVRRAEYERLVNGRDLMAMLRDPKQATLAREIMEDQTEIELEITQDIKNADMNLIPHPFLGNDLAGKTVVFLDPVSRMMEKLANMMAAGESVNDILHDGYLVVGNRALKRVTPKGTTVVSCRWKLT